MDCKVQHNQVSITCIAMHTKYTINIIYRHLSYMLYNKIQVINHLNESPSALLPDCMLDDDLYFENFHQIVAQLQQYRSTSWVPLLEEVFRKLYYNRRQFTTQIDQLYYEHFNPTNMMPPKEILDKRTWPAWNVKFLNILEINRNIRKNADAYRQFYTEDPLLSYNRCPCPLCKVDWKLNHYKLIYNIDKNLDKNDDKNQNMHDDMRDKSNNSENFTELLNH